MNNGFVKDAPRIILRAEGLALLVGCVAAYYQLHGNWGIFALCFFLPDLSFIAYFAKEAVGAAVYNALHNMVVPILIGLALGAPSWPFMLIWLAHIGFDRALGYGLKYPTAFGDTHLGQKAVPTKS